MEKKTKNSNCKRDETLELLKEIQDRLERGYTMAIYGTRENIHEQMTNDIKTLLEAINYTHCCKSDSELLCDEENLGKIKKLYTTIGGEWIEYKTE
jgi:hypothetical protein